jgi:hypothetical protein
MVQLKDVLPAHAHGSAHWQAKLTETDIPRIRELRAAGATILGLARAYGVTPPTIRSILDGITWKHVTVVTKSTK